MVPFYTGIVCCFEFVIFCEYMCGSSVCVVCLRCWYILFVMLCFGFVCVFYICVICSFYLDGIPLTNIVFCALANSRLGSIVCIVVYFSLL